MKRGYIKPIFLIVPNAKGSSVKVDTLNDGELSTFYQECKSAEESRTFIQNPNIIERQIGDEWLLVPTGEFAQQWNGMISLNEMAHFLWTQFKEAATMQQVLQHAREEFNDPHHALEIEVRNFVYEYLYNHLLFEVKQSQ